MKTIKKSIIKTFRNRYIIFLMGVFCGGLIAVVLSKLLLLS